MEDYQTPSRDQFSDPVCFNPDPQAIRDALEISWIGECGLDFEHVCESAQNKELFFQKKILG